MRGFLIASDGDDFQARPIMTMRLAKFANCEFADTICCSDKNSCEWLSLDVRDVGSCDEWISDHIQG